jgi:hypothetical protein
MSPELAPKLQLSDVPMSALSMMLDAADGVVDGKVDNSAPPRLQPATAAVTGGCWWCSTRPLWRLCALLPLRWMLLSCRWLRRRIAGVNEHKSLMNDKRWA